MNTVLIIDNDSVVLSMLTRAFSDISDDLNTVVANNGQEAIDIIKKENISLVMAEITLPDMDGIEFLTYIRTNYPHTPVFLMTAFGTSEIKKKIDAIGYHAYFEKPLNIERLKKSIQKEINMDIEGRINGIRLPSYLQMLEREQKTCTLLLSSGRKSGKLFFLKGELVYAETGELKLEDAAYEIISWDGTVIRIKPGCGKKDGKINQSLKKILMEGLKKQKKKSISTSSKNSFQKNKSPKEKPRKRQVPALDRLEKLLQHTGDIIEYAIFNDKGSLVAQHSKSHNIKKCNASSYLQFSEKLNHLVNGGKLRYIMLTREDNIRYIMFTHEKTRITAAVKPGFNANEFLKKIAA